MKEHVYINGKITSAEKASISFSDRGLNYGDGLFDTMKAYSGEVFLVREHMARLRRGARALGIDTTLLKEIEAEDGPIARLLKKNGLCQGDAYIKIVLSRGSSGAGHGPPKAVIPTIIITARAVDSRSIHTLQDEGVSAVTTAQKPSSIKGIKSLNYLPSVIAKGEAAKKGVYEALFRADDGSILEGSSTNIFIARGNEIFTPPDAELVVPGITRALVIRLIKNTPYKLTRAPVTEKLLKGADEAFLTNSIIEVVPLLKIDLVKLGSGKVGNLTRSIQGEYRAKTRD